ncbi:MAG: hypothetical protein V3V32_04315 [Dehalococcoidia bacterium]
MVEEATYSMRWIPDRFPDGTPVPFIISLMDIVGDGGGPIPLSLVEALKRKAKELREEGGERCGLS